VRQGKWVHMLALPGKRVVLAPINQGSGSALFCVVGRWASLGRAPRQNERTIRALAESDGSSIAPEGRARTIHAWWTLGPVARRPRRDRESTEARVARFEMEELFL